jgi:hypothetical protein
MKKPLIITGFALLFFWGYGHFSTSCDIRGGEIKYFFTCAKKEDPGRAQRIKEVKESIRRLFAQREKFDLDLTEVLKRDAEFTEWLEDGDVPLPKEPADLKLATEALRLAFSAGWNARWTYAQGKKQEYSH